MTRAIQSHKQDWCPSCQIGRRTARPITLVAQIHGQLLQLPEVPLYHCDICGYEEISEEAGELLEFLTSMDVDVDAESTIVSDVAQIPARSTVRRKDISAK